VIYLSGTFPSPLDELPSLLSGKYGKDGFGRDFRRKKIGGVFNT
jgi:hypothetical protein